MSEYLTIENCSNTLKYIHTKNKYHAAIKNDGSYPYLLSKIIHTTEVKMMLQNSNYSMILNFACIYFHWETLERATPKC